ncbi:uncharacterized protein ARMOST_08680 [Armillaria ostoyae]|uniref:Uncharacterized protein n=1 Tax=Armillaria ostoyae TaxID=47428 RepID=A0A284R9C2_ARMOS|nr:uncharacterized protein ARMOST_08680 [Armillaria ostoyae]
MSEHWRFQALRSLQNTVYMIYRFILIHLSVHQDEKSYRKWKDQGRKPTEHLAASSGTRIEKELRRLLTAICPSYLDLKESRCKDCKEIPGVSRDPITRSGKDALRDVLHGSIAATDPKCTSIVELFNSRVNGLNVA